jgi:putative ATP-dependent endonuclease of OLD family
MKLYQLEIKHFRGIESAKITLEKPLICFIGACDATKTTILDAIGYVLLPNWFIPLDDSDFTECDTSKPISIEATIGPVPEELKSDNKYGLCLRGWDNKAHDIVDEPDDASNTRVITIKLSIDSTLTPEWSVVTKRNPDGPHISYRDRQKLGVSLIGADIENELSWTRGSALARLTADRQDADNSVLKAGRQLRAVIKTKSLEGLNPSIEQIKIAAEQLGMKLDDLKANIDPASLRGRAATLSLHTGDVPLRRMGLGSKRLVAIGSQLQCIKDGAVLLADEIEYALEPYRIKHLLRKLKDCAVSNEAKVGQIIMTTHSPAVLEELGADPLFVVHSKNQTTTATNISNEAQGTVRRIPEAFLSPRIIVCEGATEVGLLRAFENKIIKDTARSFALNGIVCVDGDGDNSVERANSLKKHDYEICLFRDSDNKTEWEKSVVEGIKIISWDNKVCTEERIINDLPENYLDGLLNIAIELNGKQKILDNLNNYLNDPKINCAKDILQRPDSRKIIAEASTLKKKEWFKQVGKGEALGEFIFNNAFDNMKDTDLYKKLIELRKWAIGK